MISIFFIVFDYHLFIPQKELLQSINLLPTSSFRQGFYLSTGFSRTWNKLFLSQGWSSKKDVDAYLSLNRYVIPNSSLLNGLNSFELNTGGLRLRRSDYMNELFHDGFVENNNQIYISTPSSRLADLVNLKTIISDKKIVSGEFQKENFSHNVYIYRSTRSNNQVYYLPKTIKSIVYLNEVPSLVNEGYLSDTKALVETDTVIPSGGKNERQVTVWKNTETESVLKTHFKKPVFLALRKVWYPEWRLEIDGKKIDPIKTNIIHMGLVVPAGIHEIRLTFVPQTFIIGVISAVLGILMLLVIRLP